MSQVNQDEDRRPDIFQLLAIAGALSTSAGAGDKPVVRRRPYGKTGPPSSGRPKAAASRVPKARRKARRKAQRAARRRNR